MRPALARWLAAIDAAGIVAFDTETTSLDPMQARHRRRFAGGRPRPRVLHPAWRTATRALPTSSTVMPRCARLAPWLADPTQEEARAEPQVRRARARQRQISLLQGIAHDTLLESYVLESHKPHDMDNLAWRHLNLEDDQLRRGNAARAPIAHAVRAGGASNAPPSIRPRTPTSRCGCIRHLHPRIAGDAKLDFVYAQIEMPGARSAVPHGAQRHPDRRAQLLAQQSRELGATRDGARAAGAPARGPAVQSRFAQAAWRDPVPADEAARA